uniref:Uncharacterized protein n=1 Tax=Aegilops tauschii subsp. strangulata TaxID=200361 RepID=A0A453QNZ6_AEGTS
MLFLRVPRPGNQEEKAAAELPAGSRESAISSPGRLALDLARKMGRNVLSQHGEGPWEYELVTGRPLKSFSFLLLGWVGAKLGRSC